MAHQKVILKLNSSISVQEIETTFNTKCQKKILLLDASNITFLKSEIISLLLNNKQRIWLLNPSHRIVTVLKMAAVYSLIKIEILTLETIRGYDTI